MIIYTQNKALKEDIFLHLEKCANNFVPPLKTRVDLDNYANKLFSHAIIFEASTNNKLIGLVAGYFNDHSTRCGYITNVSVISDYQSCGIASNLIKKCLSYSRTVGFEAIKLSVHKKNVKAVQFYLRNGFQQLETTTDISQMLIKIEEK